MLFRGQERPFGSSLANAAEMSATAVAVLRDVVLAFAPPYPSCSRRLPKQGSDRVPEESWSVTRILLLVRRRGRYPVICVALVRMFGPTIGPPILDASGGCRRMKSTMDSRSGSGTTQCSA